MAIIKPSTRYTTHKIGSSSDPTKPIGLHDLVIVESVDDSAYPDADDRVRVAEQKDIIEDYFGTIKSKNLFNPEAATIGKYINSSGELVDGAAYAVSDFIPVAAGQSVAFSPILDGISDGNLSNLRVVYYNAAKTKLSFKTLLAIKGNNPAGTDIAPTDSAFLRFCMFLSSAYPFSLSGLVQVEFSATGSTAYEAYYTPKLSEEKIAIDKTVPELSVANEQMLPDTETWEDADSIDYSAVLGYDATGLRLIASTGETTTDVATMQLVSNYIEIAGATKLLIGVGGYAVCFYRLAGETYTFVSGVTADATNPAIVSIPEGATHVRLGLPSSGIRQRFTYCKLNRPTFKTFTWLKPYQPLLNNPLNSWQGKKVAWLGTSIPNGTGVTGLPYPKMLALELGFHVVMTCRGGQKMHTTADLKAGNGSSCLSIAEYLANGEGWTGVWSGNKPIETRSWETIFSQEAGQGKYRAADVYPPIQEDERFDASEIDIWVFDVQSNNSTSVATTDYDDFNFVTWQYGTGTFEDHRTTYLGGLIYVLDKLFAVNPYARVVFVGWDGNAGATVCEQSRMICDKLHIPYLEVLKNSNVRTGPATGVYGFMYPRIGGIHPTDYGHYLIKETLKRLMITIFVPDKETEIWGERMSEIYPIE